MPYSKDNLPEAAKNLPSKAKDIFIAAFNNAFKQYEGNEEKAFAVAWAAVKNKYRKNGDKWVEKSENDPQIVEFSMYITKASLSPSGEMLWAASASDTDKDYYDEQMSTELYRSFIKNFEKSPAGKVYVSLAHYGFLDGLGDGGTVDSIYIDGKILKAKGRFADNALGRSIFEAVKADRKEDILPEKRVRVSIGFYDYKHRHGDKFVWEFRSGNPCLLCKQGVKEKVYLDGVLEHLAVTRVPANKRTYIEIIENAVNRSEEMTTRKEDALSIVSDVKLVETLEEKSQQNKVVKSTEPEIIERDENALPENKVEMSDAKPETLEDILKSVETPEQLAVAKEKILALAATQFSTALNPSEVVQLAETVDKCEVEAHWKPLGGATSLKDADDYMNAQNVENGLYRLYSIFGAVASNIMDSEEEIGSKLDMLDKAVAEFRNKLRPDELAKMSQSERGEKATEDTKEEVIEKNITDEPQVQTPIETVPVSTETGKEISVEVPIYRETLDKLAVTLSESVDKPTQERRELFQNALQMFSTELTRLDGLMETKSNSGIQQPESQTNADIVAHVLRVVEERNAELRNSMMAELAGIKELLQNGIVSQASVTKKSIEETPNGKSQTQVPVAKAITFVKPTMNVFEKPQDDPQKPMSIRDIARATVYPRG